MEALPLIFTAVGCTAAAVWAIRSGLSGLEKALAVHVAEDELNHKSLDARVLKLERKRR